MLQRRLFPCWNGTVIEVRELGVSHASTKAWLITCRCGAHFHLPIESATARCAGLCKCGQTAIASSNLTLHRLSDDLYCQHITLHADGYRCVGTLCLSSRYRVVPLVLHLIQC